MPIGPAHNVQQPAQPALPHVVPQAQKVTPVEPSKRVTKAKDTKRTGREPEDKHRREGERGGLFDVEA